MTAPLLTRDGGRVAGRRLAGMIAGMNAAAAGAPARDSGLGFAGIAESVRLLVVDGRLPVGTRMPSERDLTAALGTSRTTVSRAYDRLRDEGYLESRRGSGSVVRLPVGARRHGVAGTAPAVTAPSVRPPASGPRASEPGPQVPTEIDLTFAALPAHPGLPQAYAAAAEELPRFLTGPAVAPLGLPELRGAVADRFSRRGLPTTPEQIVVTTGAVAGLAAVAHAVLAAGDRALIEHPGYPGGIGALRRAGARPVGWAVDAGGADVVGLAAVVRQSSPRLALLTPDFQNPTGLRVPDEGRAEMAAALRAGGVVPVVDETLLDADLEARPGPEAGAVPSPFAAHAEEAFTVGSASKSYWNGLRVGWIRVPRGEVERVLAARAGLDLGAPVLEQLVVARMIRAAEEDPAVLRPQADLARARRDHLVRLVRERLPEWQFVVPTGGHTLWCRLPFEASTALAERCAGLGVLLAPGAAFSADGRGLDRFVRLPYTLDEAVLSDAVGIIARQWAALAERGPVRRATRGLVV